MDELEINFFDSHKKEGHVFVSRGDNRMGVCEITTNTIVRNRSSDNKHCIFDCLNLVLLDIFEIGHVLRRFKFMELRDTIYKVGDIIDKYVGASEEPDAMYYDKINIMKDSKGPEIDKDGTFIYPKFVLGNHIPITGDERMITKYNAIGWPLTTFGLYRWKLHKYFKVYVYGSDKKAETYIEYNNGKEEGRMYTIGYTDAYDRRHGYVDGVINDGKFTGRAFVHGRDYYIVDNIVNSYEDIGDHTVINEYEGNM